jgi:DNA replication protein DnaD
MDVILEACERTVMATDRHRLEYAESILSSWRRENVHHKSDIHKMDELYHRKKSAPKSASGNKFNQFSQNSYDFDALEKELLSN